MLDPATGSKTVTINRLDGTVRELRKCGPSDWMRLSNIFRTMRKVWKMINLGGRPREEIQAEMDKMDLLPIRHRDLITFLNTREGQYEAILLSLAKEHPGNCPRKVLEDDFDALDLVEIDSWLPIAAQLFNVPYGPVEDDVKKNTGEAEVSPSQPGETPNPTGGDVPISSSTTTPESVTP